MNRDVVIKHLSKLLIEVWVLVWSLPCLHPFLQLAHVEMFRDDISVCEVPKTFASSRLPVERIRGISEPFVFSLIPS